MFRRRIKVIKEKLDLNNSTYIATDKPKFYIEFEANNSFFKDGDDIVIFIKKNRCIFCKKKIKLTTHHPLPYHYLKKILLANEKLPPFCDKEHRTFQNRLGKIKGDMVGDIVCRKCHDIVSDILDELIKKYRKSYAEIKD